MKLVFDSPYQSMWYREWLRALRGICDLRRAHRNDDEEALWFRVSESGFVIWLSDPSRFRQIKIIAIDELSHKGQALIEDIIQATAITLEQHNAHYVIEM